MPIQGIATSEEKRELSSQLAFLYLEKMDIPALTPAEFAKKFFDVKEEIYDVVSSHGRL